MSIFSSEPGERDMLGQPVPGSGPRDDFDPLDLPEDEQVVYEFDGYPIEHISAVAQAMAESGVPHAWDGEELVVHIDDEEVVDGVIEAAERELGVAEAAGVDLEGEVEYDLAGWHQGDRDLLYGQLDQAEVPFRLEGEVLVVAASDERLAEQVIDSIVDPSGLEKGPADAEELDEEGEAFNAMEALFLAADRLRKDATDPDGIAGLERAIGEGDEDEPPYGVEPLLWHRILDKAGTLADAIGEEDLPLARAEADELRGLLRPLV